jgi:hypothetical protein
MRRGEWKTRGRLTTGVKLNSVTKCVTMHGVVNYVIMKLCASYLHSMNGEMIFAARRCKGVELIGCQRSVIDAMEYERSIVWIAFSVFTLDWKEHVLNS